MMMKKLSVLLAVAASTATLAAPATYEIDPRHTYPSFEVDHMGGLSLWRGKFNSSAGRIVLDRVAKTGDVEVTIQTASVNFGLEAMDKHTRGPDMLDAEKFPTATYRGRFSKWNGDVPAEVDGNLTLHGVTKPVKLTINRFLCKPHPMNKRMTCGADASGQFNRDDFGVDYGKSMGFDMGVTLRISIEAAEPAAAAPGAK
jgi:polyisoprenoid-binding protein YceI